MTRTFTEPTPTAQEPALTTVSRPELSVVVPARDEAENLRSLHARVAAALDGGPSWELLLIDDGSRDGTAEVVADLAAADPRVCGVFLARGVGQSGALLAGVRAARGALIATLDADLQNDPADLPALLALLPGHDAVTGYRVVRHDSTLRRLSSRVGNVVRDGITGDVVRDSGCGIRVARAEALRALPWFDGTHRFVPTLLRQRGFRVLEHPVRHHPRGAGTTKYGVRNRAWRGLLDCLAVAWMARRALHPEVREVRRRAR